MVSLRDSSGGKGMFNLDSINVLQIDGENHLISNADDFIDLIRNKLGNDAANYIIALSEQVSDRELELEDEIEDLKTRIEELEDEVEEIEGEKDSLEDKLGLIESRIRDNIDQIIFKIKSNLEETESLIENLEEMEVFD